MKIEKLQVPLLLATATENSTARTEAPAWLVRFVEESNRIEGITRPPTEAEIAEHVDFLADAKVSVASLEHLVETICGEALRDRPGMNVRVGNHYPPKGGAFVRIRLDELCALVNQRQTTPFRTHVRYEGLHPFMDGNGRSGRALWLWMMQREGLGRVEKLGFLHTFYYQTLEAQQ